MRWSLAILVLMICLESSSQPLFECLTPERTGIRFSNTIKEDDHLNVLAYEYFYNGGGVAAGDINNDGLPDLFFVSNLGNCKLYLNQGDFHFKDITSAAGVSGHKGWKTGVALADVNADGWLDIYVCYSGKDSSLRANQLFINNHDNSFTEKAASYGLDDKACSTQAIFFDYDLDGDLDCYVLNHNIKAYRNVNVHYLKSDRDPLAGDHLYQNQQGIFKDVSAQAGISGNAISFGLGIGVSDVNNDGWPDIYVSNDYTEQDYLYINNRNGTFSSREAYAFGHMSQFSMGSAIDDINNDGWPDILTLDMLPEDNRRQKLLQGQENYELNEYMISNGFHYQYMRNMLQLNNGNGTFTELGQIAGISNTDWSWCPLLADFDNDGLKDLFVTNGYMRDYTNKDFLKFWGDYLVKQAVNRDSIRYFDIVKMMPSTNLVNYSFRNRDGLHFEKTSASWGFTEPSLSSGAAYADLDGDGDLDLVVNNINQPAFIFRNTSIIGHSLEIKLKGTSSNPFAIGARVYVYAGAGMQIADQMPVRGYQSCVTEILHFGLGAYDKADSVRVVWSGGLQQLLRKVPAGKLTVDQADAQPAPPVRLSAITPKLFARASLAPGWQHLQLGYNDFKRQPLLPCMFSMCGPRLALVDIDGDGKEEIILAGDQGQGATVFRSGTQGLEKLNISTLEADSLSVTADMAVFDANGDGFPDLYCTSGGYNDFLADDDRLQDRLFLGDGKGGFVRSEASLPNLKAAAKSVVRAADYDGDGVIDLFVGGRMVPGRYPEMPRSYLLRNEGKGKFVDVTKEEAPYLLNAGMVTGAEWLVHSGGLPNLLITGEWMAPTLLENRAGSFAASPDQENWFEGRDSLFGLWNQLTFADLDQDGDTDLVMGNWGENSQLHCNASHPLELYYGDFDGNGSVDPLLTCYIQDLSYPYVSRDELLDQIYPLRKKFTSYKSYADARLDDILAKSQIDAAQKLKANCLSTLWFENRGGRYYRRELPVEAQFGPVYAVVAHDLNGDGSIDLVLFGNNENMRLKFGRMDASQGQVFLNDGKGNFRYVNNREHGLFVAGDVRDAKMIRFQGQSYLVAGVNNGELNCFKLLR